MRIAIGGMSHETNTFCAGTTSLSAFQMNTWQEDDEIIEENRGVRNYLGGMVDECERAGYDIVPIFHTSAEPSGLIERSTYEEIEKRLLAKLQEVGDVDAVCLALHGSAVADGIDDVEGRLLTNVRRLVGPNVAIVATHDLHANVYQTSVEAADAIFSVHLYPHTDSYQRGVEAVATAVRIRSRQLRPTMHLAKIPMLIASATTDYHPASDINRICWEWESKDGVIDCAFLHGFAYADIRGARASVLVTTDDHPELAAEISQDVAGEIWKLRESFRPEITPPEVVFSIGREDDGRPIVIHESADNPGGGGPGDGTHLLRSMLEARLEDACFGFIYDPDTVVQACDAGVGAQIHVRLGGKNEPLHGDPIEVTAYVKCLTDGRFIQQSPMGLGARVNLGKMVRLVVGGIDVLVSSVRTQTFDDEVFRLHGIDVTRYKFVAIKSANHFRAAFEPIAHKIIRADTPGLVSADVSLFAYDRLKRPVWPIDDDAQFP